jgi:putative peptide zinc metalloprotease protein
MNAPAAAPAAFIPHPLRGDLTAIPQQYLGRSYTILKNPIDLSYFRLPQEQYEAARLFDGHRSAAQIADILRQQHRYWRAKTTEDAVTELGQLNQQLALGGLSRIPGHASSKRVRQSREHKGKIRFEALVGAWFYIKKSLYDPDKLLTSMVKGLGWIFTPATALALVAFLVATLVMLAENFDRVAAGTESFFTLQNVGLTWVLFIFIKTIHEFGHGITCKHYKCEVHEMGVLFILFTPYLFCNVSDSWLLPRKSHRILISSAGIVVEIFLACAAAWLWIITAPGLFNQMCYNTMFVCSISTIIFNANPLLKFDGYYIMTDLLEVPNLKAKANQYVASLVQRICLGYDKARLQASSGEIGPFFGIYAVLSYFYGWYVTYHISVYLFGILEPYGLSFLSRTYVALFLFASLIIPCYRFFKIMAQTPDSIHAAGRRVGWAAAALLLLATGLFFLPWNDSVKRTCVLQHQKIDPVIARTDGFIREIYVHHGQPVQKGQPLARLENFEISHQRDDLSLQVAGQEVAYRSAISDPDEATRLSAPLIRHQIEGARVELEHLERETRETILRAPHEGIVRNSRLQDLRDSYLKRGTPFCEIGSPDRFRVIISLDEQQARKVEVGQNVTIRLRGFSSRTYHGTITQPPVSELKQVSSAAAATSAGGDVPTEQDPNHPRQMRPTVKYYEAEAVLDDADGSLRDGLSGKARISTGKTILGLWVWNGLVDLIDPAVRL